MKPKVLIGFECSGAIRNELNVLGVKAYSCDIKPSEDNSKHHYQCDIYDALHRKKWSTIVLHPECTAVAVSGNHVYAKGKPKHHMRLAAIKYIDDLWLEAINASKIVILENPTGVLSTQSIIGKPSQTIQPYEFGDDASKKTCLWMHNIPPLKIDPDLRCSGRIVADGSERWGNQTDSGQNRLAPSEARATDRARTYPGIARAIAKHIVSNI